jgi:transcriptional regulator with XRE-family HTH domain
MKNNEKPMPASAARMKYTRENFKLTQIEFADSLGFGNSYISEMEKGERNISQNVLVNLAKVYNISPTWVLLGIGSMFLNEYKNTDDMEPGLKKLIWYCENSQFVKFSVFSFFLRLLRKDKTIIEDDIKINQASKENSTPGIKEKEKEDFNHGEKKIKAQGHIQHGGKKKENMA